jgi:hypothetical protein
VHGHGDAHRRTHIVVDALVHRPEMHRRCSAGGRWSCFVESMFDVEAALSGL